MELQSSRLHRKRPALAGLMAIIGALAVAPVASAHAILLNSAPGNDNVLQRAPGTVVLRFNEPVETAFGSIRVYGGNARRVDRGRVTRPDAKSVAIGVGSKLARGTYTVTWRVISADAHPVSGAFVFHIGAPGARPSGIAEKVLGAGTPTSVRTLFAADRFLRFILIILVAGGLGMLVSVLRDASESIRRRLAWAVSACAGLLALVSIAGLGLQGADAGAFGLGRAFDPSVISSVLDTRFGRYSLAQAIIAAATAGLAALIARQPGRLRALSAVALIAAAALVAMPALSGHARVSGGIALVADTIHVAAASAWVGGLSFVVAALLMAGPERWPLASRAVPRFSAIAVVAVAALLLGGVTNGYLQVKEWRGLWDTSYGVLLLVKTGLVLPVLALGGYNNKFAVPRLRAMAASAREQRWFLRAAGVELLIVTAVVAVTAVLVAKPPAKASVAPTGPYATSTELGPLELNFVTDPAKSGPNAVHLYLLAKNGQPAEVDEATLEASLPSKGIAPLRLNANRAGPGHYVVASAVFPFPGDWQLRIEVRRGEFDLYTQTLSIPIRKGP